MDFSEQLFAKFSGCRIFCGFSGGADSTAALLLARKLQPRFGYELHAIHFNHHLRGKESDLEAENAARFAQTLNIPFRCIDLAIPAGANLESAARNARIDAWKKLLPPRSAVLLGHHADDRKENLLIRLCRGSNAGGLSSMRPVSIVDGVTFLRPLLQMTRREIEDFLRSCGVEKWAVDSSNASTDFLRNYLRNRFLPELEKLFPGSLKGMERSINALEADAEFIDSCVAAIPPAQKKSISFWRTQHDAVRIRLLRELTGVIPTYDLLERVNREIVLTSGELRRIPVNSHVELFLRHDLIEKGHATPEVPASFFWNWQEIPVIARGRWHFSAHRITEIEKCPLTSACFDADQLPTLLEISPAHPGERMIPFGSVNDEKIKKLRTDRRIPADHPFPVMRAAGKVCWAVMVRHGAFAAVTPETRNIVKFEFEEY
ncbi:MAG: tRNA lysidine(34) synthetase TilS [Lentisphaeria bacterium]|nr:tRNA lysidine(34) synthetase TilS [Lentisphaeria bacterium]